MNCDLIKKEQKQKQYSLRMRIKKAILRQPLKLSPSKGNIRHSQPLHSVIQQQHQYLKKSNKNFRQSNNLSQHNDKVNSNSGESLLLYNQWPYHNSSSYQSRDLMDQHVNQLIRNPNISLYPISNEDNLLKRQGSNLKLTTIKEKIEKYFAQEEVKRRLLKGNVVEVRGSDAKLDEGENSVVQNCQQQPQPRRIQGIFSSLTSLTRRKQTKHLYDMMKRRLNFSLINKAIIRDRELLSLSSSNNNRKHSNNIIINSNRMQDNVDNDMSEDVIFRRRRSINIVNDKRQRYQQQQQQKEKLLHSKKHSKSNSDYEGDNRLVVDQEEQRIIKQALQKGLLSENQIHALKSLGYNVKWLTLRDDKQLNYQTSDSRHRAKTQVIANHQLPLPLGTIITNPLKLPHKLSAITPSPTSHSHKTANFQPSLIIPSKLQNTTNYQQLQSQLRYKQYSKPKERLKQLLKMENKNKHPMNLIECYYDSFETSKRVGNGYSSSYNSHNSNSNNSTITHTKQQQQQHKGIILSSEVNNSYHYHHLPASYPTILTSSQSSSLSPLHKKRKLQIDSKNLDGHNFNSLIKHRDNISNSHHYQQQQQQQIVENINQNNNNNNNKRVFFINKSGNNTKQHRQQQNNTLSNLLEKIEMRNSELEKISRLQVIDVLKSQQQKNNCLLKSKQQQSKIINGLTLSRYVQEDNNNNNHHYNALNQIKSIPNNNSNYHLNQPFLAINNTNNSSSINNGNFIVQYPRKEYLQMMGSKELNKNNNISNNYKSEWSVFEPWKNHVVNEEEYETYYQQQTQDCK